MDDAFMFGVAVGSTIAVVGLGVTLILFLTHDRLGAEDEEIEWQTELQGLLRVPLGNEIRGNRTITVPIHDKLVDFTSADGRSYDVVTAFPDRDLVAAFRDGSFVASGSGWERLSPEERSAVEAFARDSGRIEFGRAQLRARGTSDAVLAAERVVAVARAVIGDARPQLGEILRRVTSADDPGRVSIVDIPASLGTLSEPGTAARGALSTKHPLTFATRTWASAGEGEDRVLASPAGEAVVIVVADGAGGTGGGAAAAEKILARTQQVAAALVSGVYAPVELLAELDRTLAPTGAQAAATVAVMTTTRVFGACAGDVEALYDVGGISYDLTREHRRKPLLGSGDVEPVAFSAEGAGRLLIATDGLFSYAKHDAIREILTSASIQSAPDRLVELVRLRSGALQDDVGLAICSLAEPST